jgi:Natural resistance-associated macrophage protein
MSYERTDTVLGTFVVIISAAALMMTGAWAARCTNTVGNFTDAGAIAHLLGQHSPALGSIFAIILMDASILGAAPVTLATSYVFGDVFGLKHSLHRRFADAKQFYLSFTAMVVLAAAIVLIPGAPLLLITTVVQALAGLLMPSATVFLLLLCNDRHVLGPWVNRPWLNWIAGLIVGALLVVSGILIATTLFRDLSVVTVTEYLAAAIVIGVPLAVGGLKWLEHRHGTQPPLPPLPEGVDKTHWRMPPLTLLEPVTWSTSRKSNDQRRHHPGHAERKRRRRRALPRGSDVPATPNHLRLARPHRHRTVARAGEKPSGWFRLCPGVVTSSVAVAAVGVCGLGWPCAGVDVGCAAVAPSGKHAVGVAVGTGIGRAPASTAATRTLDGH